MSTNENTEDVKNLTLSGMTLPNLLLIILSAGIVGVSIYMTNNFFAEHFPTTLGSASSICDLSSFWSCDSATYSPLSQIASVPISVLSIILGLFFLVHSIFPSKQSESTGKFLATINMIGCIVLFIYSLAVLGSLCPLCTAYYVLSLGIFILFWSKSSITAAPSIKISIPWIILLLAVSFGTRYFHQKKIVRQKTINAQIVKQFFKLPVGNQADPIHGKVLLQATGKDAPIKISMFSDFECPYCQLLAQDLEKAAKQFPGKVQATYFFYPLDSSCNPNIKTKFHQSACKAAYASYCSSDFKAAHDEIYEHQKELKGDFINEFITKNKLEACVKSEDTKKAILASIMHGDAAFQVKATPTLIINGVRIKPLPKSQFIALFKAIIEKNGNAFQF